MNPGLPTVTGRQVVRALQRAGFAVDRVVGSHHVMVRDGDPRVVVMVPAHGARDLKFGTLRAIIRQAGLTVDGFKDLL